MAMALGGILGDAGETLVDEVTKDAYTAVTDAKSTAEEVVVLCQVPPQGKSTRAGTFVPGDGSVADESLARL